MAACVYNGVDSVKQPMKNQGQKLDSNEPRKSQGYSTTVDDATLDSIRKQCC